MFSKEIIENLNKLISFYNRRPINQIDLDGFEQHKYHAKQRLYIYLSTSAHAESVQINWGAFNYIKSAWWNEKDKA